MSAAPVVPLLDVSNLGKSYGRIRALESISFAIHRSEVVGLIGPNGAGKTTLFECLAGVLSRDSGEIRVNGQAVAAGAPPSDVFYLPDAIAPWPSQTVKWAMGFMAGFFGAPANRQQDMVRRLDVATLMERPIGALSKGQRKRALLAIALAMPHPMLLIDEPFEGLDLRQTRDVSAVLREEASTGRTLLVSIHQIADAARLCDRFILLSGGRVKGDGTIDALAAQVPGATPVRDLEEVFLALT
jgi:ABC-2 type transport system ATP-binding protein